MLNPHESYYGRPVDTAAKETMSFSQRLDSEQWQNHLYNIRYGRQPKPSDDVFVLACNAMENATFLNQGNRLAHALRLLKTSKLYKCSVEQYNINDDIRYCVSFYFGDIIINPKQKYLLLTRSWMNSIVSASEEAIVENIKKQLRRVNRRLAYKQE